MQEVTGCFNTKFLLLESAYIKLFMVGMEQQIYTTKYSTMQHLLPNTLHLVKDLWLEQRDQMLDSNTLHLQLQCKQHENGSDDFVFKRYYG